MIWYIALTTLGGLAGLFTFVFQCRKGQFDDTEEAKYLPFRE